MTAVNVAHWQGRLFLSLRSLPGITLCKHLRHQNPARGFRLTDLRPCSVQPSRTFKILCFLPVVLDTTTYLDHHTRTH